MNNYDPYEDEEEDDDELYEPFARETFIPVETIAEEEREINGVKRSAVLKYGFDENLEFGFQYTQSIAFDLMMLPAPDYGQEGTLTYKTDNDE